jgi:hypothetical protein
MARGKGRKEGRKRERSHSIKAQKTTKALLIFVKRIELVSKFRRRLRPPRTESVALIKFGHAVQRESSGNCC